MAPGAALKCAIALWIANLSFFLALLWAPLGISDRRRARKAKQSQRTEDCRSNQESSDIKNDDDFGDKEFPSWSWCGWTNGKMDYTADTTDGCSQNAHGWLEHHTWIQWHVRDYQGLREASLITMHQAPGMVVVRSIQENESGKMKFTTNRAQCASAE